VIAVVAAAAAGLAASLAGTALVVRRRLSGRSHSAGEERWRTDAVPRLGGVAMFLGFMIGTAILAASGALDTRQGFGFIAALTVVAGVGLYDDLRGLRPLSKVIGQIAAAAILLMTGTTVEIVAVEPLASVLTFVWVVAMTNAFNLLDNMDGLAGGVGLVAAVLLAVHAHLAGLNEVAALAVLVAAVTAGFVPFNFRLRARAAVYMGDGGSQLLGFTLAWLALASSWQEASSLVAAIAIPFLVLAIPILDTALVSIVRLVEGRPIHQGGRDHTSHRLVIYGLSEKRAVLLLVGGAAVLGASSLAYVEYGRVIPALVGVALSVALLVHFGLFLVQAMRQEARPATQGSGGWLSFDTYRLHKRRLLEGLVDLILIVAAYYLAYVLRYDQLPDDLNAELIGESLPFLVVARYGALLYFGLYKGLWRYAGTRDVARVFLAVVASEAVAVAALTVVFRFEDYSRSVFVIDALLCFVFIAGSRLAERGLGEWFQSQRDRRGVPRALIVGAGDAGNALLRELRARGEYLVAGFVDDDPAKHGLRSQGVRVLGGHEHIELILDRHRPEVAYVTIPDAPAERLDHISAACRRVGTRCTLIRSYHTLTEAEGEQATP
jgi:UDP-GlcNAc:undecaprenyl-phosphate GlcNAc-1-phosphate transferase